jgi:hypothetical protein
VSTLIKTAIVAAVVAAVIVSWPDIQRYIKISQM